MADTGKKEKKRFGIIPYAIISIIAVLLLFGITLIVLELKFKEPISITLSEWLKLAIPIVGAALVAIFAFLGVDRLKNFDEQQEKQENKINDAIAKQETKIEGRNKEQDQLLSEAIRKQDEKIEKYTKELNDKTSQNRVALLEELLSKVKSSIAEIKPELETEYSEWNNYLQTKQEEFEESISQIEAKIEEYAEKYGSFEEFRSIVDTIGNVAEAHNYLKDLKSEDSDDNSKLQRVRIIQVLVKRVSDGEIKGDSADYHNMGAELARKDYYDYAADVVGKGLEFFPDNIDLISDSIRYSQQAGKKELVTNGMKKLEEIGPEYWNWRAFTFFIDALNDGATSDDNKNKALKYVKEYKEIIPYDERAYMAEYETYSKYGEFEAAEQALIQAEKTLKMTAQCSLRRAERCLSRGDYTEAINSATRAIISQAEGQPSSNTGSAFAFRGFAKDALIHEAIAAGEKAEDLREKIGSAIDDFKMAMKLGNPYTTNVLTRIMILMNIIPNEKEEA